MGARMGRGWLVPLEEYLDLCRENGWEPKNPGHSSNEPTKRRAISMPRLLSVDPERG
jgi:hypothetical protein